MSPDSEGLNAAVVAGVGSSLTQPSGISYFSQYIFSKVLASVMILGRNSLLMFIYIEIYKKETKNVKFTNKSHMN